MTPLRSASTVATLAALVVGLLAIACQSPTAVPTSTERDRVLADFAARTDALRARVTVLRGSLGFALDSLPAASAPHRVAVEARALMQVADSPRC